MKCKPGISLLLLLVCGVAGAQESSAGPNEGGVPPDEIYEAEAPVVSDPLVEELNQQYARRAGESTESGALGTARTQPLIDVGRWIGAIALVIAMVLVLGFLARRFGSRTPLLAGADLGQVLGRVYLNRQAALYYVETGGRVLVIGVTNNAVSLVSEFDANAFDSAGESAVEPPSDAETFLSQLEASARAMQGRSGGARVTPARSGGAAAVPEDVASMKRDIERMRRMLAEED